jgi:hypothetical protein
VQMDAARKTAIILASYSHRNFGRGKIAGYQKGRKDYFFELAHYDMSQHCDVVRPSLGGRLPRVGEIAFAGTFCALVGAGTLIALALLRRKQREKHACEINELRRLTFPIISSLNAGTLDYQLALQALEEILPSGPHRAQVVERLLFEGKDSMVS